MLDDFRTRPRETLAGIINRRKEHHPEWKVPVAVRTLDWMFLRDSRARDVFATIAVRLLRAKRN
jgi:hypothetical protein